MQHHRNIMVYIIPRRLYLSYTVILANTRMAFAIVSSSHIYAISPQHYKAQRNCVHIVWDILYKNICIRLIAVTSLELHGVSNYRQLDNYFAVLFRPISNKTPKLCIAGLFLRGIHRSYYKEPVMPTYVSMSWYHHVHNYSPLRHAVMTLDVHCTTGRRER